MKRAKIRTKEAGMSLLEVLIAGIVLTTGLLVGVLPMISYAVSTMRVTDEETIAKQKAREVMESIYGARNTAQLGWDSVMMTTDPCTTNGTSVVCGVFVPNEQSMLGAGPDGIIGTADDTGVQTFTMANGQTRTLNEFKRTITIGDYTMPDGSKSSTLRTLKVDVTYPFANGLTRTYSIQTLISQYK